MPQKIALENSIIRAEFVPDDGGRLISLTDKRSGRDYIWLNKRTIDLPRYYGADYDSLSGGGVEEAFPCVLPEQHNGENYPFFGELWAVPWQIEGQSESELTLSRFSSLMPALVKKSWKIENSSLICNYEIENQGFTPLECLFGVHPSFAVQKGDRLVLPECVYTKGVFAPDEDGEAPQFEWPFAGKCDLSYILPDESSGACYQFSREKMPDGFIRLNAEDGRGLCLSYDHTFFTSLSVWQIYGGWRGHYVLMTEFFSGWPLKLTEAAAQRNCLIIESKSCVSSKIKYSLL